MFSNQWSKKRKKKIVSRINFRVAVSGAQLGSATAG